MAQALKEIASEQQTGPRLERSITFHMVGDWGMANFHRICSWLAQHFTDRTGPKSRVAIWNLRDGGIEALTNVFDGVAQLCISTPAAMIPDALTGRGPFAACGAMPSLRALATLPQNDRLVLAVDPKYGIRSFDDLRRIKPALRIATSSNDGTNLIGYTANEYLQAHGITPEVLASWNATIVTTTRPEQALALVVSGDADAVLQEAIMTPGWTHLVEDLEYVPLPAEPQALRCVIERNPGFKATDLPAGYWRNLRTTLPCLDFSDFIVLVREDLDEDIAGLLTWILVETRGGVERQYGHHTQQKSPLGWPMDPYAMAKTPIPLHEGAKRYYAEAGYIDTLA
ncbi:hypothetical protein M409DRAFT_16603 [Zasmidium cellare ATCC 36951]|uniref:SsuA/THI5-like domain-containing protein n=1 Tax=Zasmidium cellare ATCC 36951 TaxID=1080233 RepID=A0A6A6CZV8_ZASCE|nr:uncharacterized protein M409DRAFT_16603 [Zasmidium cellare ATCC 36951]KAF2172641.1 hypothetical protein M409DRAFT_16603 [Zasmidium cellare ATCC 36951]